MQGPKWPFLLILIVYEPDGVMRLVLGQVFYLSRASRTKETLPDFRELCRVTRHPRVFRWLTGCQRTPRFWGVTVCIRAKVNNYLGSSVGVVMSLVLIPAS